jgi:putative dehydrogenase
MERVGVIGLGNMGMGMAGNLLSKGFAVTAFDVRQDRINELARLGAKAAVSPREVGEQSEIVFIMVLNGAQVKDVVVGENGLLKGMKPGSVMICTATIKRSMLIETAKAAAEAGVDFLDSPVSGGRLGANAGTLTMMVGGRKEVLDRCETVMQVVGKNIFHVGGEPGMGQTAKSALQAFIGSTYGGIFEGLVLGTKAGVKPEILYSIFSTSVAGSTLVKNTIKHILARKFKDGGSCIKTLHKDLGNSLQMAQENGVPMFTTSAAYQLFQAGHSLRPEEDNWTIIKILEEITGTEVKGNLPPE